MQDNIRKAEYNVTKQDKCVVAGQLGGLHAANRANNLRAYFREDGVQIVERESSEPDWQVRYEFKKWGRDGSMREASRMTPSSEKNTNRVSYARPGVTEWYENSEKGLEHGFTVNERPSGEGEVVIEGAFSGDVSARLNRNGDAVEFTAPDGRTVLQYAKLVVTDATGRQLPARMELRNGEGFTTENAKSAKKNHPVIPSPSVILNEVRSLSSRETLAQERSFAFAPKKQNL